MQNINDLLGTFRTSLSTHISNLQQQESQREAEEDNVEMRGSTGWMRSAMMRERNMQRQMYNEDSSPDTPEPGAHRKIGH